MSDEVIKTLGFYALVAFGVHCGLDYAKTQLFVTGRQILTRRRADEHEVDVPRIRPALR